MKTRKSAGKPNAEWLVRERTVKSNSEKSSGSLNCFPFLTGLGIKANSTKCKSAMLICLTAFSSDYPPISDLIHLARCVKFNPQFNPWIVLIGLRGTEFNRRINLLRGFGRFNLGLALIGFRTTGARASKVKLLQSKQGRTTRDKSCSSIHRNQTALSSLGGRGANARSFHKRSMCQC